MKAKRKIENAPLSPSNKLAKINQGEISCSDALFDRNHVLKTLGFDEKHLSKDGILYTTRNPKLQLQFAENDTSTTVLFFLYWQKHDHTVEDVTLLNVIEGKADIVWSKKFSFEFDKSPKSSMENCANRVSRYFLERIIRECLKPIFVNNKELEKKWSEGDHLRTRFCQVYEEGKWMFVPSLLLLSLEIAISLKPKNQSFTLYQFAEAIVVVRETITTSYHRPDYMSPPSGIDQFLKETTSTIKNEIEKMKTDYKKLKKSEGHDWKLQSSLMGHFSKHGDALKSLASYYNMSESAAQISRSLRPINIWGSKLTFKMGRYKYAKDRDSDFSVSLFDTTRQETNVCKKCLLDFELFEHSAHLKNLTLSKMLSLYRDGQGKCIKMLFSDRDGQGKCIKKKRTTNHDQERYGTLLATYFETHDSGERFSDILERIRVKWMKSGCCNDDIAEFCAIDENIGKVLNSLKDTLGLCKGVPFVHYGPYVVLFSSQKHFSKEDFDKCGLPAFNIRKASIVSPVIEHIKTHCRKRPKSCVLALKALRIGGNVDYDRLDHVRTSIMGRSLYIDPYVPDHWIYFDANPTIRDKKKLQRFFELKVWDKHNLDLDSSPMDTINFLGREYDFRVKHFTTSLAFPSANPKWKNLQKREERDFQMSLLQESLLYPFNSLTITNTGFMKYMKIWDEELRKTHLSEKERREKVNALKEIVQWRRVTFSLSIVSIMKSNIQLPGTTKTQSCLRYLFDLHHYDSKVNKWETFMSIRNIQLHCSTDEPQNEIFFSMALKNEALGKFCAPHSIANCRCGNCQTTMNKRTPQNMLRSSDFCCRRLFDADIKSRRSKHLKEKFSKHSFKCFADFCFPKVTFPKSFRKIEDFYSAINKFLYGDDHGNKSVYDLWLPMCFVEKTISEMRNRNLLSKGPYIPPLPKIHYRSLRREEYGEEFWTSERKTDSVLLDFDPMRYPDVHELSTRKFDFLSALSFALFKSDNDSFKTDVKERVNLPNCENDDYFFKNLSLFANALRTSIYVHRANVRDWDLYEWVEFPYTAEKNCKRAALFLRKNESSRKKRNNGNVEKLFQLVDWQQAQTASQSSST
ncbi:hypothetical protein L596_016026 [Steinernema carpocapsae]|uniref:Uncharacterized protein n=1 Tax=Steinernema carpocapsae TaxID=34508 RepID=A0A4U5NHQ9_STECR|nr:hypothetical protein L596_016026 [Steinernema carpocapsae]